jgi:hypothetical protein
MGIYSSKVKVQPLIQKNDRRTDDKKIDEVEYDSLRKWLTSLFILCTFEELKQLQSLQIELLYDLMKNKKIHKQNLNIDLCTQYTLIQITKEKNERKLDEGKCDDKQLTVYDNRARSNSIYIYATPSNSPGRENYKLSPHNLSLNSFDNSPTSRDCKNRCVSPTIPPSNNSSSSEIKNSNYVTYDSFNSEKKYDYNLLLDCVYKGLTYVPIIEHTINNPPEKYTKEKVIYEVLLKAIKGNNCIIFQHYSKYILQFDYTKTSALTNNGFLHNSIQCLDILLGHIKDKFYYTELIHENINKIILNEDHKIVDANWYILNFGNMLISPENLYKIWINKRELWQPLLYNNISTLTQILCNTSVTTYGWSNAFSDPDLSFLKSLNEVLHLDFILDDIQKEEYFKLYVVHNRNYSNIKIFLEIFKYNLHFIVEYIYKISNNYLIHIFNYYYSAGCIIHLATELLKHDVHVFSIQQRIDVAINTDYNTFTNENKNITIKKLLSVYINIV